MTMRGYDWISHQAWLTMPDLALPWMILGGLGLAIASNQPLFRSDSVDLPESDLSVQTPPKAAIVPAKAPPAVPTMGQSLPNETSRKATSVSFEIPKKPSQDAPYSS